MLVRTKYRALRVGEFFVAAVLAAVVDNPFGGGELVVRRFARVGFVAEEEAARDIGGCRPATAAWEPMVNCRSAGLNPLAPKNQMAHEVTRDVTAWAFISFRRQSWYRTDSLGNLLPGLGPPRSAQHETTVACHFIQTVGSRQSPPRSPAQQGGMAVSRLDGRGLSLSRARS